MSDEGRLVADRYRIVHRIGSGAMGAVWQAQDEVLHRTVAIKQLMLQPGLDEHEAEDARARTMREGRIAARLHHPNAISVFDVVTDDNGQPCLIMEYLPSTSLAQILQQDKTLPPLEVARIGAQVAAALKEAHAVDIVHRDVKPGNVLLGSSGTVKITDFGISRAKDDVTVTKTGMIAGTPAYLAPEVAVGDDPGPESDVFSLGSTLYAATEGQPPFGLSENTLGLLHAVAAGQINPPRQSGTLASVLAVMLHPDIQHRPTAEEAEELLAAVARGETPLGGPADETRVTPTGAAGAGAAGVGAAALGAGALGAGAAAADRGGESDEVPTGHSGSLGEAAPTRGFYDDYYDDPVDDYGSPAGFPEQDYDGYPVYDDDPSPTRAVPLGAGGYPDYDDYYAEPAGDSGYHAPPPDDEPAERGTWKKPVAIGGVVAAGLVAFGVWLFGGVGGNDTKDQQPAQPPAAPTTSSMEAPPPPPPSTTMSEAPETETSTTTKSTRSKTSTRSKSQTQTQDPGPPSDTGGNEPTRPTGPTQSSPTQSSTSSQTNSQSNSPGSSQSGR